MANETVLAAFVLGHNSSKYCLDTILGYNVGFSVGIDGDAKKIGPGQPVVRKQLLGTEDQQEGLSRFKAEWRRLSGLRKYRDGAVAITADGSLRAAKCNKSSADGLITRQ